MDKQERHYNIFKLNRVFAISSILFLLLLIWTFADDYSRSWRTYQSEFRQMEIVQTDSLLKLEEKILNEMSEYQEALSLLKTVEESLTEKDEELERLEMQRIYHHQVN